MQKTTQWGLVFLAALVLLAAGCEQTAAPELPGDSLDGKLAISVGGRSNSASRALLPEIAKNAVNFYEVIFYDGTDYTRIAWYKGQSARLAVPPGDYNGDTSNAGQPAAGKGWAILLAGTNNAGTHGQDYTLLAVGKLTKTSNSPDGTTDDGTTNITVATKWVQFTLFALEAVTSTDPDQSSFKITAGTGVTKTDDLTEVPTAAMNGGAKVPYFALPKGKDDIKAEYKIGSLNEVDVGSNKLGAFLKFHNSNPGTLTTTGVFADNGVVGVNLVESGTKIIVPTAGDLSGGIIEMDLETPSQDGLSLLQIDARVRGLHGGLDSIVWHLRGGLFNYQPDSITGNTEKTNSTGGGILLAIGAAGSSNINIGSAMVTGVTVTPNTVLVTKGGTQTFTANVAGTGAYNHQVIWSIAGNSEAATIIDQTGLLNVASTETGNLVITATSVQDGTKAGSTPTPAVTGVTVTAAGNVTDVAKGATLQFSQTITGTGILYDGVTWDVTDEAGDPVDSLINTTGLLNVDSGETAPKLIITATSVQDTAKSGSVTLEVTP